MCILGDEVAGSQVSQKMRHMQGSFLHGNFSPVVALDSVCRVRAEDLGRRV